MYTASHRVHVDVPLERIIGFLEEPRNHVRMSPGLISIETTGDEDGDGWSGRYVYKLAGVRLEGTVDAVERDVPSRLVHELSGAIEGRVQATLETRDDGTTIDYTAEYDLPRTVLAVVPEATATAYVRRDLECALENLKTHLEATGTG
ncbi:MAG: carbon monoxide dehydrogenase subunit G [Natronomonas sp.]|jgi:carbon monoxide dehydrogenase subunit G